MGKVVAGFAMSLDGFIADAQDDVGRLYGWLAGGDTPVKAPSGDRVFMTSAASAAHYQELFETTGALVTGRRDFDVSRAWGGQSPLGVPTFIVTHHPPAEWAGKDAPFTFITEGVERAVAQARQLAGSKNTLVSGSQIVQQAIRAGLLEEIAIDLVPVLLGQGIRLFDNLGGSPVDLEITRVVEAPGVTHLRYRVKA